MTTATSSTATGGEKPVIPAAACVVIALGAIALAAVVLLAAYAPLARLLVTSPPPPVEPLADSKTKAREREFADRLAAASSKVAKRSPFHPPVEVEPPAPRVPAFYGGPSIIGVAGGAVYFSDNKRIAQGQTVDGVQVIKIDAPWTVRLGWMGGEYDVVMLERRPVSFDSPLNVKDTLFQFQAGSSVPATQPK